jgi:hypothetical protein
METTMHPDSQRSDWTDTDLLTFGDAVERLEEAIGDLRAQLEARRAGADGPLSVADLEDRLSRFEQAINDFRARPATQ